MLYLTIRTMSISNHQTICNNVFRVVISNNISHVIRHKTHGFRFYRVRPQTRRLLGNLANWLQPHRQIHGFLDQIKSRQFKHRLHCMLLLIAIGTTFSDAVLILSATISTLQELSLCVPLAISEDFYRPPLENARIRGPLDYLYSHLSFPLP